MDFLLKPFSYEEFLNASTKAFQYFEQSRNQNTANTKSDDYIFLKVEYQLIKVLLKDITHVEAYKDYVKVYLLNKPHPILSLTSLKNMEELLPAERFMRIHRSFIISLEHIDSISRNMVNIGGTQITVGENHKENFMKFISKWMG